MGDLLSFFRQFHPLREGDFALLADSLRKKECKKGDIITRPGEVQRELYFVKSGLQMSFYEGHKTHVIAFTYAPGLCADPASFSLQKPSEYFISCLSDSEMEYVTFEKLNALFEQSQELERLFRKMTEHVLAGLIRRHIELHSMTIEERYKNFCQRSGHLLHTVPHKYIASYLNIDSTNFSKLYNSVKF